MSTDVKEFKDDVVMPYRGRDQRMPEMEDDDGSQNDQTETSPQEDTSFISMEKGNEEVSQSTSKDPSNKDEGWENRYNNLRTFGDRKITELSDEIKRLKLEGEISQSTPIPSTQEEVSDWMEKYPDTANVIETMIINRTQEASKPLDDRLDKVEKRERKAARVEAELEIKQKHSDYTDLQKSDHFKSWIVSQPDAIVGCLTNPQQFDAFGAIRAIDLYKSDLQQDSRQEQEEVQTKKREQSAADFVPTNQRTDVKSPQNKKVWTTTEIGRLKPSEYDKFDKEIDLARLEGRVVQG